MKNFFFRYSSVLVGIVGLFTGMSREVVAENPDHVINKAQAELAKEPLTISSKDGRKHSFIIEVAKTPKEQEIGEMFRTSIPENGGMLFMWPAPQRSMMWMKNTLVSLDMVFIGVDHHIQAIAENTVPYSLAPVSSQGPVIATLELKGGITEKLGIKVGDVVDSAIFDNSISNEKKSVQNQ